MLKIIINGTVLQLPPDISISYSMENPLFSTDRIPVPYTQNFDVSATPYNLQALGYPNRVTSGVDYSQVNPGEIHHSGLLISKGFFIIDKATDKIISLNFRGAIFPESVKRALYNIDIGEQYIGTTESQPGNRPGSIQSHVGNSMRSFCDIMDTYANLTLPDFVAAPTHIKGKSPIVTNDGTRADRPTGERPESDITKTSSYCDISTFINTYRPKSTQGGGGGFGDGTGSITPIHDRYYISTLRLTGILSKIIPSFRIGFILSKIIKSNINNNIFDSILSNLMMLCNYASTYEITSLSPVWNIVGERVVLKLSDYMPDITAVDFISEILRLPCATLFASNTEYSIELNSDILKKTAIKDWSGKIFDGYAITLREGEDYIFSINSLSEPIPEGMDIIDVETIQQMVTLIDGMPLRNDDNIFCCRVKKTGQLFKIAPNNTLSTATETHWDCTLHSQGVEVVAPESERGSFDMSLTGGVIPTVVENYVGDSLYYVPIFKDGKTNHIRYYCPEIEIDTNSPKRGKDILFGLYHGMQLTPATNAGGKFLYPMISHTNVLPDGSINGELSLMESDLIEKFHKPFKKWVEKDKRVVKCDVLLSPTEVRYLDLREKVHFLGRDFFINTINIPIIIDDILPCEVELIEA